MVLIGFLLIGGECGDAGGVGGLDNGVKVEGYGLVGLVAEVGEVEGDTGGSPLDTGHHMTDLQLELDGIDKDYIVGIGMIDVAASVELKLYMQAVDMTTGKVHDSNRTGGENQAGIVDMHRAVGIGEALLIDSGELVVLYMLVGVSLLGEAALDDGAEDGGGVLHGLEERTLPQLRLRLVVVERLGLAAAELLAKASVKDTVANGACLFDEGWFDLCHNVFITEEQYI